LVFDVNASPAGVRDGGDVGETQGQGMEVVRQF